MRTIGVRELKAHLSQILREVQTGDPILVTDRGRVVAELRRPGAAAIVESPVDRTLRSMAVAGTLRLAEPSPVPYPESPVSVRPGTARELLDEQRADR